MKVKNRKYVLKRIGAEALFPILITMIFLAGILFDKYKLVLPLLFIIYLAGQSYFGYWPKLTLDALFFNIKTDAFLVLNNTPKIDNNTPNKVFGESYLRYEFYVMRIRDKKGIVFPETEVTGCLPNDIVTIKYYRLSKVILSCKLVEKADPDKAMQ